MSKMNKSELNDAGDQLICGMCDKLFTKQWVLRRHQREQHSGMEFRCQYCDGFACKRQENLKIHIMNIHPEMVNEPIFTSPYLPPLLPTFDMSQKSIRKKIPSVMTSVSLENLPANVTVKQPTKNRKSSPRQEIPFISNRVNRIGSVTITPNQISKSATKLTRIMPKPQPMLEIQKNENINDDFIEIEYLDEDLIELESHHKRSAAPIDATSPQPPKKKFIQLEVMTNEGDISECGDMLDEKHSSMSILEVKEIPCPLRKNLYSETNKLTKTEIEKFHKKNGIVVRRRDPPGPVLKFDDINFSDNIKQEIEHQGFSKPTALQSVVLPVALSGYDVISVSRPKKGWKLSYILPAIVHLNNQEEVQPGEGPIVLIIAPDEDAVSNIHMIAENFIRHENFNILCTTELESLRDLVLDNQEDGFSIMIATLGEVTELLREELVDLSRCSYLVIDDIEKIGSLTYLEDVFDKVRKDSQILVRCCDLSKSLQNFLDRFLKDYVHVNISNL